MKVEAILNEQAGSLRGLDRREFRKHIETSFGDEGHEIEVSILEPANLEKALAKAGNSDCDTILACGGDGTITCAAKNCIAGQKTLGVVPGGTMNLYARALGVPLDPHKAVETLASAKVNKVDYATANGHLYLHQYSVGMQPSLVRKRSRYDYDSRIGKILAGLRATAEMVTAPPKFHCEYILDGRHHAGKLSMIAISNNLHAEGHLPYPDKLDAGILGVYSCPPVSTAASAKLVSDLLMGMWSTNPDLKVQDASKVILRFSKTGRGQKALIDGELVPLESEVKIRIHTRGLSVLDPKITGDNKA